MPFLFAVIGAIAGSFLNVCIARWPKNESVVRPRSHCPSCAANIAWYDNIPIISWLLLRARCRHCGARIGAQYPLVEITSAVIWLSVCVLHGPSIIAVRLALVVTILLGVAITDAQSFLIPDGFTFGGLILALAGSVVGLVLGEQAPFAGPWNALLGACVGAGAITILGWLGELAFKKEAMGYGDATLMAFVGALVGPGRALATIFVGAFLASVIFLVLVVPIAWSRARRTGIAFVTPLVPFGVFLAPAALVTLLFGNALIAAYVRFVFG